MTIPDAGNTPVPGARLGVEVATRTQLFPSFTERNSSFGCESYLALVQRKPPTPRSYSTPLDVAVGCKAKVVDSYTLMTDRPSWCKGFHL